MKRHAGMSKAHLLIDLANRSIGTQKALNPHKFHLKQLLEEYDLATVQLEAVEQEVSNVLIQIPCAKKILAIKGISTITLAGILGESGDLVDSLMAMLYYAMLVCISPRRALENGKDKLSYPNEEGPD